MRARVILSSALTTIFLATSANAATITNLESRPHIVKVQSAEQVEHVTVLPKEKISIDQFCPAKCVVTMENTATYEIKPDDKLILRNGRVTIEPAE